MLLILKVAEICRVAISENLVSVCRGCKRWTDDGERQVITFILILLIAHISDKEEILKYVKFSILG